MRNGKTERIKEGVSKGTGGVSQTCFPPSLLLAHSCNSFFLCLRVCVSVRASVVGSFAHNAIKRLVEQDSLWFRNLQLKLHVLHDRDHDTLVTDH